MEQHELGTERDDPSEIDEYPYEDPMSPFDRFVKVFTGASRAFEGLLDSPKKGSIIQWGYLLAILITMASTLILNSSVEMSPRIKAEMDKYREKFEQQYKEGKYTKEQYEQIVSQFDQQADMSTNAIWPTLFRAVWWIFGGLIVFAISKALEKEPDERLTFSASLSVYMIALMISVVLHVVYTLLAVALNNYDYGLTLWAAIPTKSIMTTAVLGLIDPAEIWWMIAVGTGIAVISRTSTKKAITVFSVTWLAINGIYLLGTYYVGTLFMGD